MLMTSNNSGHPLITGLVTVPLHKFTITVGQYMTDPSLITNVLFLYDSKAPIFLCTSDHNRDTIRAQSFFVAKMVLTVS